MNKGSRRYKSENDEEYASEVLTMRNLDTYQKFGIQLRIKSQVREQAEEWYASLRSGPDMSLRGLLKMYADGLLVNWPLLSTYNRCR